MIVQDGLQLTLELVLAGSLVHFALVQQTSTIGPIHVTVELEGDG